MNILFIEYPHAHFQKQRKLVEAGHTVYTNWQDCEYYKKFNINTINFTNHWSQWTEDNCQEVIDKINELNITTVIVGLPTLYWLRDKMPEGVTYLGATQLAAEAEINKFTTRNAIADLGIKVIPIVAEGNTANIDFTSFTERPVVIKAKDTTNSARVLQVGQDTIAENYYKDLSVNEHYDYYIEQFLPNMKLEVEVYFCIANGKWSIYYSGELRGETERRDFISNAPDGAWTTTCTLHKIPDNLSAVVTANAKTFLNWLAPQGGNYTGSVNFAIDNNDDVYWVETNTREDAFSCLPLYFSGDVYLEAITSNPQKYIVDTTDWVFTTVVSTINNDPNQVYPLEMHDKYNIEYPNCLQYYNDTYHSYLGGVVIHSQGPLPSEFINKLTENNYVLI
tara:strand:- start:4965 stop:6143 length:1179 start_codon:yes stop_codon:yes gene_type:complete